MTMRDDVSILWARSLGVAHVAPEDNFFALGGHSLLAVKLLAQVQEKLNLDGELTLADLFDHPTLGEFAAHLEARMAPAAESGEI